ncbi:MAG: CopD family protein [Rhodopila sp.]|jgi:uncharacterized membrane protein
MTILYAVLKALHLLSAVLWVGGMFFAYVILRPSLTAIEPPQRMLLQTQVHQKFFLVVWHAMPIILVSGFIMLAYRGMSGVGWQVHAMLALGLVMAGVFLFIVFGPWKQFRRTIDRSRMADTQTKIRNLIGINLILGLITVIIAGLI